MQTESFIPGKDASLESTIHTMQHKLTARGFNLDESSWLNPVESIWSVHVRDQECPMLFANGKGATKLAARASALGEFFERLNTHYFWTHFYLGESRANRSFVHYSARALVCADAGRQMADRNAQFRIARVLQPRGGNSKIPCWSTLTPAMCHAAFVLYRTLDYAMVRKPGYRSISSEICMSATAWQQATP